MILKFIQRLILNRTLKRFTKNSDLHNTIRTLKKYYMYIYKNSKKKTSSHMIRQTIGIYALKKKGIFKTL